MSERELLELAAKAAGYDFDGNIVRDKYSSNVWNPLESDGDALRLALQLGIEFGYGWNNDDSIQRIIIDDDLHVMVEGGDACAAARRAIVMAAADIGRKSP